LENLNAALNWVDGQHSQFPGFLDDIKGIS